MLTVHLIYRAESRLQKYLKATLLAHSVFEFLLTLCLLISFILYMDNRNICTELAIKPNKLRIEILSLTENRFVRTSCFYGAAFAK